VRTAGFVHGKLAGFDYGTLGAGFGTTEDVLDYGKTVLDSGSGTVVGHSGFGMTVVDSGRTALDFDSGRTAPGFGSGNDVLDSGFRLIAVDFEFGMIVKGC